MRFFVFSAVLLALLTGCNPATPPPAAAPAGPSYATAMSMKQLMEWVIDSAADTVWESVAIIVTERGEDHKAPKTDEDWAKVRTGAATLVEAGNLLMLPHHTRGEAWDKAAQRMSEAAQTALSATAKKDVDALFDSGAAIYNACSACHQAQRVGEDTPGADAAKAPPGTAPVNTK
jgi:mono/diheme cytochrome c family protein